MEVVDSLGDDVLVDDVSDEVDVVFDPPVVEVDEVELLELSPPSVEVPVSSFSPASCFFAGFPASTGFFPLSIFPLLPESSAST